MSPVRLRGLTCWLCAAAAALAPGCGEQVSSSGARRADRAALPEDPPGAWITYRSADWGYAVSFPESWQRATETLTPELTEPREILALGTFPLSYGERDCAHVPKSALERMSEEDAFLTLQERGADPGAEWVDFPSRPARFAFEPGRSSEAAYCVGGPVRFIDHWFGFTDAERHFHVEVALGRAAAELRQEAYRILDTLRFDPAVTPDWRASP
jgi:hypothetical protein